MTKHESREYAFLLLYETLLRSEPPEPLEDIFLATEETLDLAPTEAVKETVAAVLAEQDELDAIISQYSATRKVNRVAAINRTILRLALFELRHKPETPVNVVISEAVMLSRAYAYPEDTSFINGVLGNYARDRAKANEENENGTDLGA